MDYASEQAMELEALEAILMDDLIEYEGTLPDGWVATGKSYKVVIDPGEDDGEEAEYPVQMELIFAHTPSYPEEAPSIRLKAVCGLSDADLADGMRVMREQIEANLGMAMIYTLIGAAKEWLQAKAQGASGPAEDPEVAARKAAEEEEKKRQAARAHGTPVTVEVFKAWKAKFDAEVALQKAKLAEAQKDDEKAKRLTGKLYFLSQQQTGEDDELGALSEDDEEDFEAEAPANAEELEDDDEDFDYDEDDEDDEDGMLDEYLAKKQ